MLTPLANGQANTLRPYLTCIRNTLTAAMCLQVHTNLSEFALELKRPSFEALLGLIHP